MKSNRKILWTLCFSLIYQIVISQQISIDSIKSYLSFLAADNMKGRQVGSDENDKAAKYIASIFERNHLAYCIGNSYLISFDYQGKTVYNVCGIKKGLSDSSIGFGGHFDHIGIATRDDTKNNDSIYNGADDDASGVTMVLGLSDYFSKKENLPYSLLFMAYNAEEIGLVGSATLCSRFDFKPTLDKMKAEFNFEMIGAFSEKGINKMYMTGSELSNLDELINQYSVNNLEIFGDPYPSENLFYRSDNVNFVKHDVVSHSFSTVDMNTNNYYHQVNDDISVINFENLYSLINNFALTVDNAMKNSFYPKYLYKREKK